MKKLLIFFIFITLFVDVLANEKQIELKKQLSSLKQQTVTLHDDLLKNSKRLIPRKFLLSAL